MPVTLIDGIVNQAIPTRRFRSTWMGLITHTAPSFVIVVAILFLVMLRACLLILTWAATPCGGSRGSAPLLAI